MNIHQKLKRQSHGGVEPVGHIFSRLLKFCHAICFSEEQLGDCMRTLTMSRLGSPSPRRVAAPGISGMRARLSVV